MTYPSLRKILALTGAMLVATVSATFTLRETGQVTWSGSYDGAADDLYRLSDVAAGRLDTQLRQIINSLDGERI